MSLENVLARHQNLVNQIRKQGFDLESLAFLCKDLFGVLNDLEIQSCELEEFMANLKLVYDHKEGKQTDDTGEVPMKVTVTNTLTKNVIFFILCNNDSKPSKYSCELCAGTFTKGELKKHVIDHESTINFG